MSEGARHLEQQAATKGLDPHLAKAFDMVSSSAAQKAFDLDAVPRAVREKYGAHTFGQQCLLARRLVEAGVRLAQITWPRSEHRRPRWAWYDTHQNEFPADRDRPVPGDRPGDEPRRPPAAPRIAAGPWVSSLIARGHEQFFGPDGLFEGIRAKSAGK